MGKRKQGPPARQVDEERYLSAGWPDYTSHAGRAMRDELPPMPESMEDAQARSAWLALALGQARERVEPAPRRPRPRVEGVCAFCSAVLPVPGRRQKLESVRFCGDGCRRLARNERMRGK